ncbi:hypothetical protein BB559_003761, partial [Furculomyces boomerangus]
MLFKQSLVLLATAVTLAVSQSAQSITGYLPAGLKGNALMVTQGKYPVPNFRELTQSSDYNPLLYTPDNITETGWTLDSLSFLKTMNFDPTNLLCLNGDISSVCTNVPDLGMCCGGWCLNLEECCFYNIACGYWYGCIPKKCRPTRPTNCSSSSKTRTSTSSSKAPSSTSSSKAPSSTSSSKAPSTINSHIQPQQTNVFSTMPDSKGSINSTINSHIQPQQTNVFSTMPDSKGSINSTINSHIQPQQTN